MGQGLDIRILRPDDLPGTLRVDLSHLRRVFDNLFSNLRKYADPNGPVTIRISAENRQLHISLTNTILSGSNRVESNRIGLKTCEKLLAAMDGSFRQIRDDGSFTAEVTLPLYPAQ